MLNQQQKQQIAERGISQEKFDVQLKNFETGFPYLQIVDAATPKCGIKVLDDAAQTKEQENANNYKGSVCKFVPASGAATRMFKDLFEAVDKLNAGEKLAEGSPAHKFVSNISLFPFSPDS